jgi:protein TonB
MTLTYSQWTPEREAPAPPAVFGMRPAIASHPLQRQTRDRLLSAAVSAGGQLLVAGLVLFASWNAIKPEPKPQTITVSINVAQERVQPVEPPPQVERVEMVRPTMAAPEILIQTPPSANAPIFVAAPPPPPAPPLSEKVAEAAPVTPPRFDAAYLKNPAPNYPNMSRRLREIGTVQLRVRVSAVGEPLEVLMAKSSGYGRLDESALAAVKKWKFQPATRGDTAIEAWVLVPVEFSLKG